MNIPLLTGGAAGFGLKLDEDSVSRFRIYMEELKRWNRSINLTAIKGDDQIVIKHFLDSLAIARHIPKGAALLDIGSGAGFPSLAVAIVRADISVTSIDAVDKKVRFQRHICRLLHLDNVAVIHGRVEELRQKNGDDFDIVTSRAFRDLERFAQLACNLVKGGGLMIAMKGGGYLPDDTVLQSLEERFSLKIDSAEKYSLPQGAGKRQILLLRRNIPQ